MKLSGLETFVMILAVMLGTMITRFTPFLLFPDSREVPRPVRYLGRVLPPAMIGLLVVYSLKAVQPGVYPFGLPELSAVLLIVGLQLWRRNALLSIGGGTLLYMLLVQKIFV